MYTKLLTSLTSDVHGAAPYVGVLVNADGVGLPHVLACCLPNTVQVLASMEAEQ